jgi:hypothetical protein
MAYQFALVVEFEEYTAVVLTLVLVVLDHCRGDDDVLVAVESCLAASERHGFHFFLVLAFNKEVEMFVEDEDHDVIVAVVREISGHEKVVVSHFEDAGGSGVVSFPVIPELGMCPVGLNSHQECVREAFFNVFSSGKKSDTILIDKPIDKCCVSRKMFADIADDPFLRGQMKTGQT